MEFTKTQIKEFYELAESHLKSDADEFNVYQNEVEVEFIHHGNLKLLISGICTASFYEEEDTNFSCWLNKDVELSELGIWNEKLEEWQAI